MVAILVRFNNIDKSLRDLKKRMQLEGIFKVMKTKREYEKPSEIKVRKRAESIRRRRKFNRHS